MEEENIAGEMKNIQNRGQVGRLTLAQKPTRINNLFATFFVFSIPKTFRMQFFDLQNQTFLFLLHRTLYFIRLLCDHCWFDSLFLSLSFLFQSFDLLADVDPPTRFTIFYFNNSAVELFSSIVVAFERWPVRWPEWKWWLWLMFFIYLRVYKYTQFYFKKKVEFMIIGSMNYLLQNLAASYWIITKLLDLRIDRAWNSLLQLFAFVPRSFYPT